MNWREIEMAYILETSGLTKQYKKQKALDQVDMHIERGSIYGFIGRNGAGKTTFMKIISGLSYADKGEIYLFGEKINKHSEYFSRIGALIENPGLYPNMSAYENLKMKCLCMGYSKKGYIDELIELVGLKEAGKKKVRKYSLGMKQRLGIAMALIGEPDILVLDEPINGLDPQGILEVRQTIETLNKERNMTVLISSHILGELSKFATHYGIIDHGQLVEELTRDEMMTKCCERIEIKVENTSQCCMVLDDMGYEKYKVMDKETICVFERIDESKELIVALVNKGVYPSSVAVKLEALEDYYLGMTGGRMDA